MDVTAQLGITPICLVSDSEIWTHLVTPTVKGLLGPIVSQAAPEVLETVQGKFSGDEVSNLNDHRLYGGKTGFVRHPYIYSMYKTLNGAFIVKRDGVKFEAFCWYGDIDRSPELILKAALRDRRYDGTPRANDTALVDFPYDDPKHNAPLHSELKSVELSIYGFMPGSRIVDATGEPEFDRFFASPFSFADRPELFLKYFNRAWNTKRAPGQHAAPIRDVASHALPGFERIARAHGYDVIEMAASHYHVAKWAQSGGYVFSSSEQAREFASMTEGLAAIRAAGHPLTRSQQSWACVAQNLPAEHIPAALNMHGPLWMQDNLGQKCLWVHKPLSEAAHRLLSARI
ncbi:MAG: hypothetical protein EKK48_16780 [Candidatus Melainabacteria bacterium]|nr:MAG: hypothetical protein EKK48_16780 [Candidatus Melainabacteria bacterium]